MINWIVTSSHLIAKHPKNALVTLMLVILVAAIAVGCTFTGRQAETPEPSASTGSTEETTEPPAETTEPASTGYPEVEAPTVPKETLPAAFLDSAMLFHGGKLYVVESWFNSEGVVPYLYTADGAVQSRDDTKHPTEEGAASLLDPGTKIYTTNDNGISLYTCDSSGNVLKFVLHTSCMPTPETDPLAYYQQLFTNTQNTNYYAMALTSLYDTPEQVDLSQLFYSGVPIQDSPAITDTEKTYLVSKGFEPMLDIQRTPASAFDSVLQSYFGIRFEQSQKIGLDKMTYWEETDCYYTNHNDYNGIAGFTVIDVQQNQDGLISVYYQYSTDGRFGKSGDVLLVTLRPGDQGMPHIVSHQLASYTPAA